MNLKWTRTQSNAENLIYADFVRGFCHLFTFLVQSNSWVVLLSILFNCRIRIFGFRLSTCSHLIFHSIYIFRKFYLLTRFINFCSWIRFELVKIGPGVLFDRETFLSRPHRPSHHWDFEFWFRFDFVSRVTHKSYFEVRYILDLFRIWLVIQPTRHPCGNL